MLVDLMISLCFTLIFVSLFFGIWLYKNDYLDLQSGNIPVVLRPESIPIILFLLIIWLPQLNLRNESSNSYVNKIDAIKHVEEEIQITHNDNNVACVQSPSECYQASLVNVPDINKQTIINTRINDNTESLYFTESSKVHYLDLALLRSGNPYVESLNVSNQRYLHNVAYIDQSSNTLITVDPYRGLESYGDGLWKQYSIDQTNNVLNLRRNNFIHTPRVTDRSYPYGFAIDKNKKYIYVNQSVNNSFQSVIKVYDYETGEEHPDAEIETEDLYIKGLENRVNQMYPTKLQVHGDYLYFLTDRRVMRYKLYDFENPKFNEDDLELVAMGDAFSRINSYAIDTYSNEILILLQGTYESSNNQLHGVLKTSISSLNNSITVKSYDHKDGTAKYFNANKEFLSNRDIWLHIGVHYSISERFILGVDSIVDSIGDIYISGKIGNNYSIVRLKNPFPRPPLELNSKLQINAYYNDGNVGIGTTGPTDLEAYNEGGTKDPVKHSNIYQDLEGANSYYNDGNVGIGIGLPTQSLQVNERVANIIIASTPNFVAKFNAAGEHEDSLIYQDTEGQFLVGTEVANPARQLLDVLGAINVGDTTTGTEGAIKYSGLNQDLEGYVNGEWKSLTAGANGSTTPATNLWTENVSGDVYRDTNNVGIGTITPTYKLEVSDTTRDNVALISNNRATAYLRVENSTSSAQLGVINGDMVVNANGVEALRGVDNGAYVGVGTNNPTNKLTVDSGARPNISEFKNIHASKTAQLLIRNSDTFTQIGLKDTDVTVDIAGTEQVRVTASGDVGVGTSAPNEKLQVSGAINVGNTTNMNAGSIRYNGSDLEGYVDSTWKSLTQTAPATSPTIWELDGMDAYYNDGNVGVGTNDPYSKLSLGTSPLNEAGSRLALYELNDGAGDKAQLFLRNDGDSYFDRLLGVGQTDPLEKLDINGELRLSTIANTNAGTLRYDNNDFEGYNGSSWVSLTNDTENIWSLNGTNSYYNDGNVGIGTDSPFSDILGNTGVSKTDRNGGLFVYASPGFVYGIDLGYENNRYRTRSISPDGANISFATHVGGTSPQSQSDFTEHMVIRGDSGNVGIGTNSPSEKLEVSGNVKANGFVQLELTTGMPSIACANATHRGRMVVDSKVSLLWICMDSGWVSK